MRVEFHMVCLFVLFTIVFSETDEEIKKIADTCQKKIQASKEEMKVLEDVTTVPKTQNEYCLLACYFKAREIMDANNKLVHEKAILEIEELKKDKDIYDKFSKIIKDCIAEITPNKTDECESIKLYNECIMKKSKEMGVDA